MALKNKDYGVSFVRLISMMMIISCHIFQFFENELAYWFNSGVQIFLFISGLLYGQRLKQCDYRFVKRSFIKILLDYYITIVFCIALCVIFAPEVLSIKELVKLVLCYGFGGISSLSHLWFIPIILFCYLITPVIGTYINEKLNQINLKKIVGIIGCLSILYVILKLFFSYFIAEMVVCYCIGLVIGKIKTLYEEKWQRALALAILPLAIIVNGMRIYINYILQVSFKGETMKMIYESFEQCTRVALGISLFLILYYIYYHGLNKVKGIPRILDLSDVYSYDIYLGHQMWILGTFSLLRLKLPVGIRIGLVIVACILQGVVIHLFATMIKRRLNRG